MKMMRTFLSVLAGILLPVCLSAQTVSGKLIDENNQPMPYANVVLLSLPDSAFVTGMVSGEDGTFTLPVKQPNLLLRVSSIGYVTLYNKVEQAELGTLQLLPNAQMLGEVVVKADLPKMRLKGDAMVTTVQGSILEKAGTGEDLLNKIPGVSAKDGSVNVFGAGTPEIYINGRKVRDQSELSQLSSDNIKSVEVVNNPGSRYDATVNAVIRIRTKKPQGEGFGFNNRFYTEYRYDWSVLDQFNFNYRKGGFDLSGMLFGKDKKSEDNKGVYQETFLDKVWKQDSWLTNSIHSQNLSAMLSANYQFNENHSIGIRYDFDRTPRLDSQLQMQTDVFQDDAFYEQGCNSGWQGNTNTAHTLNAYYSGQAGDWNIDLNADGLWMEGKTPQETMETTVSADGTRTEQPVTSLSRDKNTLYAVKLTAVHPLWKGNLLIGSEYTYTNRENYYWNEEGILANDQSNIRENNVSVFAEYTRNFGKLQAQAGIRYEHLTSDYFEDGKRIDAQSRTYDNVFPSVSLSLPVGKAQLQLNYTGSIYRPIYWMLRSNTTYINRYTYEGGNPLLQPSLINRVSLSASYKWIYFNTRYIHGSDAIVQLCRSYSEQDPTISLLSYYNRYDSDKLYTTLTLSPTIGIWSPQWTVLFLQQWYKVDTPDGQTNFNHPLVNFIWNNSFQLPKGFLLDVNLGADTSGHNENGYVTEGCWYANVSLYKGFFNDRLSFRLQANDLFNSSQAKVTLYSGSQLLTMDQETRRSISMTIRYKFNTAKSKYKGTGAGESQKSRM